ADRGGGYSGKISGGARRRVLRLWRTRAAPARGPRLARIFPRLRRAREIYARAAWLVRALSRRRVWLPVSPARRPAGRRVARNRERRTRSPARRDRFAQRRRVPC